MHRRQAKGDPMEEKSLVPSFDFLEHRFRFGAPVVYGEDIGEKRSFMLDPLKMAWGLDSATTGRGKVV